MIRDGMEQAGDWDVTHSYDRSAERPSEVVVRAVAGTTNQPACSIEPLYDAIEPDALDAFIGKKDRDESTWVTFRYEGCRVYVDRETVSVVGTDGEAVADCR